MEKFVKALAESIKSIPSADTESIVKARVELTIRYVAKELEASGIISYEQYCEMMSETEKLN